VPNPLHVEPGTQPVEKDLVGIALASKRETVAEVRNVELPTEAR
jgi:hypothetical protein